MMKTALLVIDAQKAYTSPESELFCEDSKHTISRINALIKHFGDKNDPIFLVQHIHKADGSDLGRMFDYLGDVVDEIGFQEGSDEVEFDANLTRPSKAIELRKTHYSSFVETGLEERLRQLAVEKVVICGFMTNCCCDSTARDAHSRGFFVDFVIDATGTPGTENYDEAEVRRITRDFMEAAFAHVVTTDDLLSA